VALGATVTFPTDPTITSIVDDPTGVTVTTVKAAHITELRSSVNAVRSLAGLSAVTWTNATLTAGVTGISADDVRDLRSKLDEALVALAIQVSSYTDSPLAGAPNGTLIKKTHITELRQRATSGSGGSGSGGSSGGVQYVLSDAQGSSRAVMNNNGVGTSAISARHDYLPFGQEIGAGTGLRTGTQTYNASDTNRQKYALTERDDTTGLDHTWWRKYENTAGRWTSPDPYNGSMTVANPQSFNRYSYVQNDPVNFVDPTGLFPEYEVIWTFSSAPRWRGVFGLGGGSGGARRDLAEDLPVDGGVGGATQNPQQPTSCEKFAQSLADHLFNHTVKSSMLPGQLNVDDATLARIGVIMQKQAFDNVDFSGRTYEKAQTPIDGFQTQLTNNGQDADVYHHILFTAGGELDTNWGAQTNGAFLLFDQQQAFRGRKESETEVRDDYAGIAVGRKMLIMGRLGRRADFAELTKQIADILCL
jgi:RHS repeat-associated protein